MVNQQETRFNMNRPIYWLVIWPLTIAVIVAFLAVAFWVAKNGSYYLWYEDMVIETIKETVKAECLIAI